MSQKNTTHISRIILGVVIFVFLVIPIMDVSANDLKTEIIGKLIDVRGSSGLNNPDIPTTIGQIIKWTLTLVGSLFLILIIYAGFLWMTAGGSPEQVKKAGTIIRNSIIGLVIVVISYAVTITVFDVILKATS